MRIALFEPEIAGNVGAILRTAACFGVPVDIIEPCGFPFADRALKRAGMDYSARADWHRHKSWADYCAALGDTGRLVLFTTTAATALPNFTFHADDRLLFGSESAATSNP